MNRRALIKRSIALASVGYVAPMVLGSATPASAQAVSSTCDAEEGDCEIPCQESGCFCLPLNQGGSGVCIVGTCSFDDPCTSNADCGDPNLVCVDPECGACLGDQSFCIPLCGSFEVNALNGHTAASIPWWQELR